MKTPAKLGFLSLGSGVGMWLAARALREARAVDFKDRVVAITGGSRGLGLVLARDSAERARLALLSRRADELDRAHDDLRASSGSCFNRATERERD